MRQTAVVFGRLPHVIRIDSKVERQNRYECEVKGLFLRRQCKFDENQTVLDTLDRAFRRINGHAVPIPVCNLVRGILEVCNVHFRADVAADEISFGVAGQKLGLDAHEIVFGFLFATEFRGKVQCISGGREENNLVFRPVSGQRADLCHQRSGQRIGVFIFQEQFQIAAVGKADVDPQNDGEGCIEKIAGETEHRRVWMVFQ